MRERAQNRFVFQARSEFDLAKLHGLKSAGGIQLVAKTEETNRSHGFQDVNLGDQQFFDLHHPPQRVRRLRGAVFFHRGDCGLKLVQDLLKPEFISLMHGNEKQLIVMRRRRQASLQFN